MALHSNCRTSSSSTTTRPQSKPTNIHGPATRLHCVAIRQKKVQITNRQRAVIGFGPGGPSTPGTATDTFQLNVSQLHPFQDFHGGRGRGEHKEMGNMWSPEQSTFYLVRDTRGGHRVKWSVQGYTARGRGQGAAHLRGNTWLYFGDVDPCGLI